MEIVFNSPEEILGFFSSIIPRTEGLYVWCYDIGGNLLSSTCPFEPVLDMAFEILGAKEKALKLGRESANPLLLGSHIGMQWGVIFSEHESFHLMFVLGPVLYSVPMESRIRKSLREFINTRDKSIWASSFYKTLPNISIMPYSVITRYAVLFSNIINSTSLDLSEIRSYSGQQNELSETERNRSDIYLAERALLQMVKTGDINYQWAFQSSSKLSPGVPIKGEDPLRQMKTSITVFTTLVSRAAMEGGLSPGIAYTLGDSYIQDCENCRDSGEISALANAMYHDFICRVHDLRSNPEYSSAVQKCCDYIELNLDKKIRASDLASLCGYTEYYLTEKFSSETGQSVADYVKYAKMERAKSMLVSTNLPVRDISTALAFNTPNYFSECFREITGYTPVQYRKKFQRQA